MSLRDTAPHLANNSLTSPNDCKLPADGGDVLQDLIFHRKLKPGLKCGKLISVNSHKATEKVALS
jgi:hypothetical protein